MARLQQTPNKAERGDTIVEVLIALAVISLLLAGAFVLSRTSSRNIQTSQEHTEAVELLKGQVELLRNLAVNHDPHLASQPRGATHPFCIDETSHAVTAGTCHHNMYKLTIVRGNDDTPGNNGTNFTFSVDWPALDGGTNHESFVYRIGLT